MCAKLPSEVGFGRAVQRVTTGFDFLMGFGRTANNARDATQEVECKRRRRLHVALSRENQVVAQLRRLHACVRQFEGVRSESELRTGTGARG